jgi:hypothetical protein
MQQVKELREKYNNTINTNVTQPLFGFSQGTIYSLLFTQLYKTVHNSNRRNNN